MRLSVELTPMLALMIRRQAAAMNVGANDVIEEALRRYLFRRQIWPFPVDPAPAANERVIQF